ncbi:hypothetical protein JHK87_009800 [Glycine soja]|nr:hypothetical protein JHK87_009800 [Glycine soja]
MQQQWVDIIGNIKEQVRNEYEEQHKRSLEEFKKELSSQIFIQLSQMGSQYSPLIEVDLQALAARLSTKGSNVETADVDPSGDKNVLTEDIVKCHVRSHMSSLVGSINPESRKAKVVANIPFNISTNVIKLLLPMGDIFSEVVLLLQVRIDSSLVSI